MENRCPRTQCAKCRRDSTNLYSFGAKRRKHYLEATKEGLKLYLQMVWPGSPDIYNSATLGSIRPKSKSNYIRMSIELDRLVSCTLGLSRSRFRKSYPQNGALDDSCAVRVLTLGAHQHQLSSTRTRGNGVLLRSCRHRKWQDLGSHRMTLRT